MHGRGGHILMLCVVNSAVYRELELIIDFVILFGESRNTGKLVIIGKLISSSESCCEMQAEPCSYQNYHPSIWF